MRSPKTVTSAIIFLVAGSFCSCSKDDASPCGCTPLALTKDPLDYQQEGVYPVNVSPSFDPAGNGQFAYFKGGGTRPQLTGIWRASLVAPRNEQQLLTSGDFQLELHWGSRGWLTYNNRAGQVMKLKSNGDSLQQLTSGIAHYAPVWSPDARKIVCELDGPRPQQHGLVVLDDTGRQVSIIGPKPYGYAQAWSPDGRKLAVVYNPSNSEYGLGIYDFGTQQLKMVVPIDLSHSAAGSIYGADWLPDSRTVVWASGLGLFKVDTQTGQTVQLRSGCNSRVYLSPSVSPDGQTIIVERDDKQIVNNGTTIRSTNNLWTINIDGTNERKVEF